MKTGFYLALGCAALLSAGTAMATPRQKAPALLQKPPVFSTQPPSPERILQVLRAAKISVPSPNPPPAPKFSVSALQPINDTAFLEFFGAVWVDYHPQYGGYAIFGPPLALGDSYVNVHWKGVEGAPYLVDCTVYSHDPLRVQAAGIDETISVTDDHMLFVVKAFPKVVNGDFSIFLISPTDSKKGFAFRGCTLTPV